MTSFDLYTLCFRHLVYFVFSKREKCHRKFCKKFGPQRLGENKHGGKEEEEGKTHSKKAEKDFDTDFHTHIPRKGQSSTICCSQVVSDRAIIVFYKFLKGVSEN